MNRTALSVIVPSVCLALLATPVGAAPNPSALYCSGLGYSYQVIETAVRSSGPSEQVSPLISQL